MNNLLFSIKMTFDQVGLQNSQLWKLMLLIKNSSVKVDSNKSRLNHSCDPDVFSWTDDTSNNIIVVTSRPVQAGSEISISYKSFHEGLGKEFADPRSFLSVMSMYLTCHWGITCPENCLCQDPSVPELIRDFARLQKTAYTSGEHFYQPEHTLY